MLYSITDIVRPFVVAAAERARLSINADANMEEEEMLPEVAYQNKFEVLYQLADEGGTLEEGANEDEGPVASNEDHQEKQHDRSVNCADPPTSTTKQNDTFNQQCSLSGRAILPTKLKNKTHSADYVSTKRTLLNDGSNIDTSIQDETNTSSSPPTCGSNPLDNVADREIDQASLHTDSGLPAKLLLQPHSQATNDHDAATHGLSPMKDVEYTVVRSPISKRKEGELDKAPATIFDWPSRISNFAAQTSDSEAFCENQEEHGGKRQKINPSSTTDTASEKPTVEDPQTKNATKPAENVPEPIQTLDDLLTHIRERLGYITASGAETRVILNRNDDASLTELTLKREGSTTANLNPDKIANKTCTLNETVDTLNASREVDCTEQQPQKADASHEPSASQAQNEDDTNLVDSQDPSPPTAKRNEQIQEHDIVAATACLRVANYLVPYALQGFFPPIMFASHGVARQLGTNFDYRFHYWAHPPAYATFLQELHDRHQIALQKRITVLKLFINGDTMCIEVNRYQGGWDWCVAMDIAAQRNCRVEVWFEVE